MTRYGMVIDTKRCVACATCVVGCKVENNLPQEMRWNRVINEGGENPDSPSGTYPELKMSCYTLSCQHCSEPACVDVCPTGASYVDEATGIVLVDAEKCIGCSVCQEACPYDVRQLQEGEPVYFTDFPVGGPGVAAHVADTMEKCTFCHHRLQRGELPFCVEVCPGRARFFGDLDDPASDASKALEGREVEQLRLDAGTAPNVYLLR